MKKWEKLEKKLPTKVNIPKTINLGQKVLEIIDFHVFGDPSLLGAWAVAYEPYSSHLDSSKDYLQANQDRQRGN